MSASCSTWTSSWTCSRNQGKEKTRSSFAIGGELTQVFMLGCIAQRLGGTLKFDTRRRRITNNREADRFLVGHPPRKGWEEFYKL